MGVIKVCKMPQRHKDTKFFLTLSLCGNILFHSTNRKTIFILLMIVIASCKTRQPVATTTTPKVKTDTVKQATVVKDSIASPKQKTFHISLLLPLNLDQQFKTDTTGNDLDILPSSLPALNFYEGFVSAFDDEKDNRILIQYDVYDTERDSMSLWKLLNSQSINKSDIVMAMLSNSWNTTAAGIASARQYNLFLLQGNNAYCLNGSPKTFLTNPGNSTQCRLMAHYLHENYSGLPALILYRDNNKKESDLADLFFSELDSLSNHVATKKINYLQGGFENLKSKLSSTKKNLLVIPSSDESYISSILNKLSDLKTYNFILAGLPTWEYFESIDPSQLETFNTHIFSASFIEYQNPAVKEFRKNFISSYHADPLYSAYQADDLVQWIQYNISKNNAEIEKYQSPSALQYITNGIVPLRYCTNCGFENSVISVLKYKDGLLEKVNH